MNNNIDVSKLRDPRFYLENFCKVKQKGGGLVPFKLNEMQKDLFNTLNKNNRVMSLKARQLGSSTGVAGYFYVNTIMNTGMTTALIGYNTDLAADFLDRIKTFYRSTPAEIRPTIQYNSKYEISFPKMDSKILILPSIENVGSGYCIDQCLVSELSKWDKAEEKMSSLLPAIPLNGKLIIETTPHGAGDMFHRMWMDDSNGFIKKKYGWWWGYTRKQIEEIKRGCSPDFFNENYGLQFLAGGRAVFEQSIQEKVRSTVLEVGDINNFIAEESFKVREEEGWTIFRDPKSDEVFVMGNDVAEGVRGGDYSYATILNRKTGEEVAFYRGQVPPDVFGEILNKWGRKYNNALMVVESNNHGILTINILKKLSYPSLYFRPSKLETISLTYTDRIGWRTTGANRGYLIDDFVRSLREENLVFHSKILADEMSVFNYDDNGNMQPRKSFHDDSIFGSAICFQGFKIVYSGKLTQLDSSKYLPVNFSY
jgi:hypothetical protein